MVGYSGTASFQFEVERYENKKTRELISADIFSDDEEDFNYKLIELFIEGRSYFAPGNVYGPPENSFPDEADTEILSILDANGKDWSNSITAYERNMILLMIEEQVCDSGSEFEY